MNICIPGTCAFCACMTLCVFLFECVCMRVCCVYICVRAKARVIAWCSLCRYRQRAAQNLPPILHNLHLMLVSVTGAKNMRELVAQMESIAVSSVVVFTSQDTLFLRQEACVRAYCEDRHASCTRLIALFDCLSMFLIAVGC